MSDNFEKTNLPKMKAVELPCSQDVRTCEKELSKWLFYYISQKIYRYSAETVALYLREYFPDGNSITDLNNLKDDTKQQGKNDIISSFNNDFFNNNFKIYFDLYKGDFKGNETEFSKYILEDFIKFAEKYKKEHKSASIKDTVSLEEEYYKNTIKDERQKNINDFSQRLAEQDDEQPNADNEEENNNLPNGSIDIDINKCLREKFEKLEQNTAEKVIEKLNALKKKKIKYQFYALVISHNRWLKYMASLPPWKIIRIKSTEEKGKEIKQRIKAGRIERKTNKEPQNPNKRYYITNYTTDYKEIYDIIKKDEPIIPMFYNYICALLQIEGYSFRDRFAEEKTYKQLLKKYFVKKQLSKVKEDTVAKKLSGIIADIYKENIGPILSDIISAVRQKEINNEIYENTLKKYEDKLNKEYWQNKLKTMKLRPKLDPLPAEAYEGRDLFLITDDAKHCKELENNLLLYAAIKYYNPKNFNGKLTYIKEEHIKYCQKCKKYVEKIIQFLEYREEHRIKNPYTEHQQTQKKLEYSKIFDKENLSKNDLAYYYLQKEAYQPQNTK